MPDEEYIAARSVLLDALDALGDHRAAVILVGAQAVYLRVGESADLAIAPYTTDGDLALDPSMLGEVPPLERALGDAGFIQKGGSALGTWATQRSTPSRASLVVTVDLLVPRAVAPGEGRRAARLPGHDGRAARIVDGLEGALVDADQMPIESLQPELDARKRVVRVAGPAGLLVAKVHKIAERVGTGREKDKDALDVLRLLRGTTTDDLARRMRGVLEDAKSAAVAKNGLRHFTDLFGRASARGSEMAARASTGMVDPAEITASCEALAQDLLAAIRGR